MLQGYNKIAPSTQEVDRPFFVKFVLVTRYILVSTCFRFLDLKKIKLNFAGKFIKTSLKLKLKKRF